MKSRRKFDKQFKIDSVELLERSGKTTSEISKDLGIIMGKHFLGKVFLGMRNYIG